MDAVRQFNQRVGISLVATLVLGTETTGLQAQQGLALPPTVLEAFAAQPGSSTLETAIKSGRELPSLWPRLRECVVAVARA